jgi:hypothetical protein
MTFCIYTILFTLADKDPQSNKYVQIFQIWFSQLIKTRAVKNCVIVIDRRTLSYLKTKEIFNKLILPLRRFSLTFFEFNPPKTLIEGMTYKYSIFDYSEDYLIYTDLDVLIINSLEEFNFKTAECIYVHAEGPIMDNGYTDAMTDEEKAKLTPFSAGLSAGKFVIKGKILRDQFFKRIKSHIKSDSNFYSVDQPYFNKAIYEMTNREIINPHIIMHPYISINCRDLRKEVILIDFMGKPGDDNFHFEKMLDYLTYSNCI